jgi:hypothetical protein
MSVTLCRVAVGLALGAGLLGAASPVSPAAAQSCDPSNPEVCVRPGWDDPWLCPRPDGCAMWENGSVIMAPPYP